MSDPTHRERVLATMTEAGVDALLLGREGNVRYVSGANRLWLSGTRAVAPGCVVVGTTSTVHLLASTDDGIPGPDARDRLIPPSWNPMELLEHIARLPGVGGARRIGVDALTPMLDGLLGSVLPGAELVDGEALLRGVRRTKSAADVAAIRDACDLAVAALEATRPRLRAGVTERSLSGAFERHMAELGATTPALEASFCVAEDGARLRVFSTDRAVRDGDLLHVRAGVLRDGWEGRLSGMWVCGGAPTAMPRVDEIVAGVRADAVVGDLRSSGALLDGTGMGHEVLVDDDVLEPGMVVALECSDGARLGSAVVHVTEDDADVLLRA